MDVCTGQDPYFGRSLGGPSLVLPNQQTVCPALVHLGQLGVRFNLDALGSYKHRLVKQEMLSMARNSCPTMFGIGYLFGC